MGMLAEQVDHVIGVDRHRDSHTVSSLNLVENVLTKPSSSVVSPTYNRLVEVWS